MPTHHYVVLWMIDIDADSMEEAAQIALDVQRDPQSTATVFYVREASDTTNTATIIDTDNI